MKLFGNAGRPRVGRNTESFEPISDAKAEKARAQARKKADSARTKAYREYEKSSASGDRRTTQPRQAAHAAKPAAPGAVQGAERRGSGRRGGGAKKAVIITVCVLAVIFAGITGFAFYVSGTDTIYPNVSIGGVDLGGLTVSEAAYELSTSDWAAEDESVSVALPMERTLTVTAAEAGASVTAEQAAQTAYDYCHNGNIFSCLARYIGCLTSGGSVEAEIDVDEDAVRSTVQNAVSDILNDLQTSGVEMDEDEGVIRVVKGASSVGIDVEELTQLICSALAERRYGALDYEPEAAEGEKLDVQSLHETVYREPVDAYYDPETGEVVPSVTGVDFDTAEAERLWNAAGAGDVVEIPAEITEPEYTTEKYEELLFADDFGEPVTTSLSGSTANRINNVQLAANSINGVVLMPGEQFDYNECLGERTTERGYKAAGAYSGGQVVQEVGGGICQVSSTLYYAALLANLQIDVRSCHYFPVGYLSAGLDATVSWGGPEFRFTNNTDWPIKIEASVDTAANTVTVHIVGTNVDGTYVKMESGVTGYIYTNSEYPEVATGYKAESYRCVYSADGTLLSRTHEASSTYHYHEEDIVYPTPTPEPTPMPSEEPVSGGDVTPSAEPTEAVGNVYEDGEGYYFEH